MNIDMEKKMEEYEIVCGAEELIDLTENLWQKLNNFHKTKSIHCFYPLCTILKEK